MRSPLVRSPFEVSAQDAVDMLARAAAHCTVSPMGTLQLPSDARRRVDLDYLRGAVTARLMGLTPPHPEGVRLVATHRATAFLRGAGGEPLVLSAGKAIRLYRAFYDLAGARWYLIVREDDDRNFSDPLPGFFDPAHFALVNGAACSAHIAPLPSACVA